MNCDNIVPGMFWVVYTISLYLIKAGDLKY